VRVLAFDPGRRRIGVAVSDELGLLARPVAIVQRRSTRQDRDRLAALIDELQPAQLLVGLPLLPSGAAGEQAAYSRRFGAWLETEFELPVVYWNESYSSVEAAERRRTRGRAGRGGWSHLDADAAAIILQSYLDSRR
jgi:putative Holliday junction resolvase